MISWICRRFLPSIFACLISGMVFSTDYSPGSFPAEARPDERQQIVDLQKEAKRAIMPPLSQYGPLHAPILQTAGLGSATRRVVEAAIAAARQASKKVIEAETVVRTADRAASLGREAARTAETGRAGYGTRNLYFDRNPCRYRGEIVNDNATGAGVMICTSEKLEGQFRDGRPDGLIVEEQLKGGYKGEYRDGHRTGLGGDYSLRASDAYEGEFKDGRRVGLGIERDQDGSYPGRYGFYRDPRNARHRINMELLGTQDFQGSHWAGKYGSYMGPKIACVLIKGAVLEGSVLDGYAAKFDAGGHVTEQGLYKVGILTNGAGPPC
jgi:hypothetical protein